MKTQIEKKIPEKITPSPAVLAVTLGALATAANAGHRIDVDGSKVNLDLSEKIKTALSDDMFLAYAQEDTSYDFSIFRGSLFVDNEEIEISEQLLMSAAGLGNHVDADGTYCDDDIRGFAEEPPKMTNLIVAQTIIRLFVDEQSYANWLSSPRELP
ncbi:hypothetical protein [Alkalimarinus alittae]|uniref:Uncharacterized protein n=1 Tax=Alkalimarinus alittae TaxID=2961619 RepID=A0ABY6MX46_9ALTE|nr:hypothetical protein [Alkalimarinus alittae]UZE94400.1 hypothetical protein NKI27_09860 [Alkalimarinus alittae]